MAQARRDSITRRGILSALTFLPAAAALAAPDFADAASGQPTALPASPPPDVASAPSVLQPPPDPIFAAIEAHARLRGAGRLRRRRSRKPSRPPGMRRAENAALRTSG